MGLSAIVGILGTRGTRTYEEGFIAGVEETLKAVEGSADKNGKYTGPLPPELVEWISTVRKRIAS